MPLVLASSSSIRRAMLEAAGVMHDILPPGVDEAAIKTKHSSPAEVALELAKGKALAVSAQRSSDWVVGSDSIVSVDGRQFDKPANREKAAEHLRYFSGKPMILTSAVALAHGGSIDWSHCESAVLQMRELSDDFIQSYLDAEWPGVAYCVGVFRLEGPGVQLFERIDGDHFTILGMPLLPLLGALRERGMLAA